MSEEKNIKAFNYGYELAKIDPKLASSISRSSNTETMSYFREGVKRFQLEILKAKRQERDQNKEQDQSLDMDF